MGHPVFIVACARSGTTLLYSMLLAAGGFAVYRKETHFYSFLPRFRGLATAASRQRFMQAFLQGYLGKVPGLDVEPIVRGVLDNLTAGREFLPQLMRAIAEHQGVDSWVEASPSHLLHMEEIWESVPGALFIHVIRDGRDCAISNARQGWLATFPWDRGLDVPVAALYWEWVVRRGRAFGQAHPDIYLEVRFEDLLADPRATLRRIGRFIDHDLDYDRILLNPAFTMSKTNTSFREDCQSGSFNPVGRWSRSSPDELCLCEMLIGPYLQDLGYPLADPDHAAHPTARARLMRNLYLGLFSTKHWLKTRTPLGALTRTTEWEKQPRRGELLPVPTPKADAPALHESVHADNPAVTSSASLHGG
jgi:hypothetical protein